MVTIVDELERVGGSSDSNLMSEAFFLVQKCTQPKINGVYIISQRKLYDLTY